MVPKISGKFVSEGDWIVIPVTGRLYLHLNISGTHFYQRLIEPRAIVLPIMSIKTSNDTIGIKLATFRLVAQCPNQLRHRPSLFTCYVT
jgi:hypothetical protein